jgi:hypothetical protein
MRWEILTLVSQFDRFFYSLNACHNGLGEVAAFLRFFAKTVTVYPSPIDGTGYTIFG